MGARGRDYGLVILSAVLWGTSFPGGKLVLGAVDPLFLSFARLGLGAVVGFVVLALLRRLDFRVLRNPYVWGLGVVNALAFDLQNMGMDATTATKTALLVNVNVVFIAALMVLVYRERVTWQKVVGIGIGLVGVVLLATRLDPQSLEGGEFVGDLLVFAAGIAWSFYVVGTKAMVDRGGDYIALVAGIFATTSVAASVPLFFTGWPLPATTDAWIGILYLGIVPTFPPMLLYAYSMRTISPTISALLILLEVIVAGLLSAAFLQDAISGFTLVGGGLILFGAYVVARGEREIPEPGAGGLAPVPRDTRVAGLNGPESK